MACFASAAPAGDQRKDYSAVLSQALSLMRQGRITQSLAAYDEALKLAASPAQRAQALLGKGRVLRLNSRYRDAVAVYREVLGLQGPSEWQKLEAWRGLAWCGGALKDIHLQIEANQALAASKRTSDAERAMALGRLGSLWRDQGKEDKAAVAFWQVLDEFPRQAEATRSALSLVELYSRKGDAAGVDKVLAWARQQRPTDAEVLYIRAAEIAAGRRQTARALTLLDAFLAFMPTSATGWQRAWELHQVRGDAEEFLAQAQKRAQQDTAVAEGLLGIAEALAARGEAGDAAQAITLYQQLLPLVPNPARAKIGAAQAALRAGRLELADQWSREALQARPQDASAQNIRARVLVRQGKSAEAFALLKQVARYKPADLRSAQRLQSLLRSAGLEEYAAAIVAEVRRATGNPSALALTMAQHYRAAGQWSSALDELARAVDSGEASASYAATLLRSWLSDATERPALLAALRTLDHQGKLPQAFLPAEAYACLLSGEAEEGRRLLARLPADRRAAEAMRVLQWLEFAGRSDLAPSLYPLVLSGPVAPTTEMQLALTVATDLAAQGRLREAAETLQKHRKPAMPEELAVPYDLTLARLLITLGQVDRAEVLLSQLLGGPREARGEAALLLAEGAFRRGDYARARELLRPLGSSTRQAQSSGGPVMLPPGARSVPLPGAVVMLGVGGRAQEDLGRALFLLAEMDLREGHLEEAEKAFSRVVEEAPATGAATQAVQRLMTVMELRQLGDEDKQVFLQGLRALDRGDYEAAADALDRWLNSTDSPLADDARLLIAEARAAAEPEAAAADFEDLARALPDSPLAAYALFRAALLKAPIAPADALPLAQAVQRKYPASALAPLAERLADELSRREH